MTPLNELKEKGVRFSWGEDQEKAFVEIKSRLCQAPTLRLPDFNKRFVLQCDASDVAISAILNQEEEGHLAPIAYSSRKLSSLEKRYSIYEREALAVVYGCEKFRCFLEHKEFVVHTDSEALSWLRKRPHQLGRIGRWVMRLSPFKFSLVHVRGTLNAAADALSRMFGSAEVGEVIEEGSRVAVLTQFPASFQSLRSHQDADEECQALLGQVRQGDASVRQLQEKGGLLVYRPRHARKERVFVTKDLRHMIMAYFHDSELGVHLGVTKTWNKIKREFYWPDMYKIVKDYVAQCEVCLRSKPAATTKVGLHSAEIQQRPMQRLFVDFMGPMVRTKKGNQVILSIVDGFSKFVWMFPLGRISAQLVVDRLSLDIIGVFGVPESIVSDNASVFKSKIFQDFCFRWGIRHITTSPYYPQGSLVERFHRNLKAALKAFHHDQQELWDQSLHLFQLGFNDAYHESTKTVPSILFLGRQMNHPLGIKWKLQELEEGKICDVDKEWELAVRNLRKARDNVRKRYNQNRKEHQYLEGQTVVVKLHPLSSKKDKRSAKLELRWSRPLVISRFLSPVTVELVDRDTGSCVRKAHVSQLKPCGQQASLDMD